jgi:hypothetical protein
MAEKKFIVLARFAPRPSMKAGKGLMAQAFVAL